MIRQRHYTPAFYPATTFTFMLWLLILELFFKKAKNRQEFISTKEPVMSNLDTPILLEYLADKDPSIWHQVAWNWNWDGGVEVLKWIISQPQCHKGTALLVYWYGGPRYDSQFASAEEVPTFIRETYDLVREIEEKYLAGFYTSDGIKFDPHADEGIDWTAEYADIEPKVAIPEIMYEPSGGETVKRESYIEGYPPEVWDRLNSGS